MELPSWCRGKEFACQWRRHKRHWFNPRVGKIPWRKEWQPATVSLPRKFHGQRSLAGYSQERVGQDWAHTRAMTLRAWFPSPEGRGLEWDGERHPLEDVLTHAWAKCPNVSSQEDGFTAFVLVLFAVVCLFVHSARGGEGISRAITLDSGKNNLNSFVSK